MTTGQLGANEIFSTLHGEVVKIGDKVWHWVLGWGEVCDLSDSNRPIFVVFGETGAWFSEDGKIVPGGGLPLIFWDKVKCPPIPPKPNKMVKKWIWAYRSEEGYSLSAYRTCPDSSWIRSQRLDWSEKMEEETA